MYRFFGGHTWAHVELPTPCMVQHAMALKKKAKKCNREMVAARNDDRSAALRWKVGFPRL